MTVRLTRGVIARCSRAWALAALTFGITTTATPSQIGRFERARGRNMLQDVRKQIEKHYFDPTFHGVDLRTYALRADSLIRAAESNSRIFTIIAEFVQTLEDSHTLFLPPNRVAEVEYGWDLQMIGDSCYVVHVRPGSDAEAKGLMTGDRLLALDRYVPTRRYFSLLGYFLHSLSPRRSVHLEVEGSDGSRKSLDVTARFTERAIAGPWAAASEGDLYRAWGAERFPVGDSLVILRLAAFGDPEELDRVMRHIRTAGTLILDLRGNPGGQVRGVQRLVGHLFDQPVHIATVHQRRDTSVVMSRPAPRRFTGQLYVLIDSRSSSSSEVFAHLVQLNGRGVVVGDRSSGAVMQSRLHFRSIGTNSTSYALQITEADVVMPDGTRLEGQGVTPDALVLPTASDLAAGRDPALAVALSMAGYPLSAAEAGALLGRSRK